MKKAKHTEEYIRDFPKEIRDRLNEIRKRIKKTAPRAEETISYGMPAFKLNGKALVYFAAFKNHIGFFPTPSGINKFERELRKYKTSKGTLRFAYDKPIPLELIEKITRFRAKEISSEK